MYRASWVFYSNVYKVHTIENSPGCLMTEITTMWYNFCLIVLLWVVRTSSGTSLLSRNDEAFYQSWSCQNHSRGHSRRSLYCRLHGKLILSLLCTWALCFREKEQHWQGIGSLKTCCDCCNDCAERTHGDFLCPHVNIFQWGLHYQVKEWM